MCAMPQSSRVMVTFFACCSQRAASGLGMELVELHADRMAIARRRTTLFMMTAESGWGSLARSVDASSITGHRALFLEEPPKQTGFRRRWSQPPEPLRAATLNL